MVWRAAVHGYLTDVALVGVYICLERRHADKADEVLLEWTSDPGYIIESRAHNSFLWRDCNSTVDLVSKDVLMIGLASTTTVKKACCRSVCEA